MRHLTYILTTTTLFTSLSLGDVNDAQARCSCPVAVVTNRAPKPCPLLPKCGPRPMCIRLISTTVTIPDYSCIPTSTITVYPPCPTCQRGCGTTVSTITEKTPCQFPGHKVTASTLTVAGSTTSSCYTYTQIPQPTACPGLHCITPDCILLGTTTLPAHDAACPVTPVVTATPSCLPSCQAGCGTELVTVKSSTSSQQTLPASK